MKRLLSYLLILSLLAMAIPAFAEGTEYTAGDYTYIILGDGTAEITRYTGIGKNLSIAIPSELDGRRVTSIGYGAFYACYNLASVTIPSSVTILDNCAFYMCQWLKNITIPSSVTYIGDSVFYCCEGLESITIPNSITYIGANPFEGCVKLKEIRIQPDHPYLATINGVLFSKPDKRIICYPIAYNAKEYMIPQGIAVIGDNAFSYCSSLTDVKIPGSVTSIGSFAFNGCENLRDIILPTSVKTIGDHAFSGCYSLTDINIPDSVVLMGTAAFAWCSRLENVRISNSISTIEDDTFLSCNNLSSVTVPANVNIIGSTAFIGCHKLTVSVVRNSYAEQYCIGYNIQYIYFDSDSPSESLSSEGEEAYFALLFLEDTSTGSRVSPVVELAEYICFSQEEIASLELGDTLKLSQFVPIRIAIGYRLGFGTDGYQDISIHSMYISHLSDKGDVIYINRGSWDEVILQDWNGCWRMIGNDDYIPKQIIREETLNFAPNIRIYDYYTPYHITKENIPYYEWSNPYDFFVFNSNEVYFEAAITVKNGSITEMTIPRDY